MIDKEMKQINKTIAINVRTCGQTIKKEMKY